MDTSRTGSTYKDLQSNSTEKTFYFFLEHLLKARIDLQIETGRDSMDEEVNVYIAGLLQALLAGGAVLMNRPYISPYDVDIRSYVRKHRGLRTEYRVYKENADFGLVASGIFHGRRHEGSYYRRVLSMAPDNQRIALYYQLAASALMHLRGNRATLVHVFYTIARYIRDLIVILRRVSNDYFDFLERLSPGTLFHLQSDITEACLKREFSRKLDVFLGEYSSYLDDPTEEKKEVLRAKLRELRTLNPEFAFTPRL